MYQEAWTNVTTAQDTVWKVMAAYTAVFAALGFVSSVIGEGAFTVLLVVFGTVGAIVSQSANLWFTRNMGIISKIEPEFLRPDDYGKIIPREWRSRPTVKFVNREVWWIMTALFLSVNLVTVGASYYTLKPNWFCIALLTLLIGLACTALYSGAVLYPSYKRFVKGTRQQANDQRADSHP